MYAAVDIGAESGRVMIGRLERTRVSLEPVHRFSNRPIRSTTGLHWDVGGLFGQVLRGLGQAAAAANLRSVGIDTWGADYALLNNRRQMLGLPFHYRDRRTDGMIARAHERVSREELYAVTGIQTLPINTAFQLLADESSTHREADRIAFIPDLLAYWLTGELANEATVASTTGLLDARTGSWARDIIGRLDIPLHLFADGVTEPGTPLGPILPQLARSARDVAGVPVHTVAAHDTASAFAGAPIRNRRAAVLSSGTWSILGLELTHPVLTTQACAYNLSNERGIDGTTRLLANVMGLWLVQQCRSHWLQTGANYDHQELHRLAAAARPEIPVFDPDDRRFLAPGNMPARIVDACLETGQDPPTTPGEFIRSALVSLSCKYRFVLERLEFVSGQPVELVHVIGGGVQSALLCQLTATMLRRPVHAGPVEATALGNVLVQARATTGLASLDELRALAAESTEVTVYEPESGRDAEQTYRRFLGVTHLPSDPGLPLPGSDLRQPMMQEAAYDLSRKYV